MLLAVGAPLAAADVATVRRAARDTPVLERDLVLSLIDVRRGDLESAQGRLDGLLEGQPDFRLAHLIQGDLWMARANGLTTFGEGAAPDERVDQLLHEARARWVRYLRRPPPPRATPRSLLRVPSSVPSVIAIDSLANRLYLLENRNGRLVKTLDFYVSIGKGGTDKRVEGDERTPVGLYLVSEYLDGKTLPDLYGVGALPISYPNAWDKSLGRTGSGIWIHGTESTTYSRPPRSSRGCVTLSNEDFSLLRAAVKVQETPVLVTNGFDWVAPQRLAPRAQRIEERLEKWRRAWESRDTARYLSFYSDDFRSQGMSRSAFAAHKKRVNAGKKYIRVRLEDVGIYGYPGEDDVVVVDFEQHYESDSFRSTRRKHQYWRFQQGDWQIVLEESV